RARRAVVRRAPLRALISITLCASTAPPRQQARLDPRPPEEKPELDCRGHRRGSRPTRTQLRSLTGRGAHRCEHTFGRRSAKNRARYRHEQRLGAAHAARFLEIAFDGGRAIAGEEGALETFR